MTSGNVRGSDCGKTSSVILEVDYVDFGVLERQVGNSWFSKFWKSQMLSRWM